MRRKLAVVAASVMMASGVSLVAAPAASAHPGVGFEVHDTQEQCLQSLFNHVVAGQWRINCIGFLRTPYILFHY
ncbi:hypothetical protein HT102_06850 [Hoyosella sp. G463]|uniref:Secreted protein n=1 Tax=Lolliginicoccus lacisalsi TaxID=2742202 RepID=A0A927PM91_9ACTN|nr:hypothetical protein [Lolliginicoccus lacisalsi]MBD8506197.1 hypothetical protein [Lolliginicoccus lacisalsi]